MPGPAPSTRPADGALIYIIDYPSHNRLTETTRPRPRRLILGKNGRYARFGRYAAFGLSYRIEFRDRGHGVLAFIALGQATPKTRATAIRVLNSIRVPR
jgi:hypothetical protein